MRKLLTWAVVSFGIAALVRKLRARGHADEYPVTAAEGDPAEELRHKLAETREDEMPVPGAPPLPEPSIEKQDIDERRADVHEEARAAIDEMQKPDAD